jgi:hypothetical protein
MDLPSSSGERGHQRYLGPFVNLLPEIRLETVDQRGENEPAWCSQRVNHIAHATAGGEVKLGSTLPAGHVLAHRTERSHRDLHAPQARDVMVDSVVIEPRHT